MKDHDQLPAPLDAATPVGALDARAGDALRARRAMLLQHLTDHRTRSPLQPTPKVDQDRTAPFGAVVPGSWPDWGALPPALRLGLAAAAGGAIVAVRPWRLMRRVARWMAPVVSMELRARLWQHAKQAVGSVLREAVETSDRPPPR